MADGVLQIVPQAPNASTTDNNIRLVLLNPSLDGKESTQDLILSDFPSSYPLFAENTEDTATNMRNFVNDRSGTKFHTYIQNNTDFVFVLTDAYSNGCYTYVNTVWLPGDRWQCVGAWGMGCRAAFKMTMYKLKGDVASVRDRVRELFCLLPGSGQPGLHPDGAEPVSYIIFRGKVPSMQKNSMSGVELDIGDARAEMVDLKNPISLSNFLDDNKVYSRDERKFTFRNVTLDLRIEGGDDPSSHVYVWKK